MHHTDLLKEKTAGKAFDFLINEIKNASNDPNQLIWLGIGSGTTIKFFISILSKKYLEGSLPFKFFTVSSSIDSEMACRDLRLPIRQFEDLPTGKKLDFYIDGADEVDEKRRCLKGLGGASTREKLLRISSNSFYVLVDESKKVKNLCTKNPIVVEIIPFAFEQTVERLRNLNPVPSNVEIRKGSGKMGFIITDNHNYLVDLFYSKPFDQEFNFSQLEQQIKSIHGVVESGLFSDPAEVVFIASSNQVEIIQ